MNRNWGLKRRPAYRIFRYEQQEMTMHRFKNITVHYSATNYLIDGLGLAILMGFAYIGWCALK